jgi:uncharacterized protein (DUF169 family)
MEGSWRSELDGLVEVLGLESGPVAVTFTNDDLEEGGRDRVRLCRAIKLAAAGESFNIGAESVT